MVDGLKPNALTFASSCDIVEQIGDDMTIWKFPINLRLNRQSISMPAGSTSLCVQLQNGAPMLWVSCDRNAPAKLYEIAIYGTGDNMLTGVGHRYIGTLQVGRLVYHVFEVNDFRVKR